jgi:hypothetical protein
MYGDDFERFALGEWRQNGRQTTSEHGLPSPWGTNHQQRMAAGRSDLECPPRRMLSHNLAQINAVARWL